MLRIVVFVVTTRRALVNSISWLFWWSSSCKKTIITYHCWHWHTVSLCVWILHVELTKKHSSHSHLSYNLKRKTKKWPTLTGKQTEGNTWKKRARTYHLMMPIFSLFHFVSSVKFFGLNQIVSMRDLLFLFIFDFIWIKGNIKSPR